MRATIRYEDQRYKDVLRLKHKPDAVVKLADGRFILLDFKCVATESHNALAAGADIKRGAALNAAEVTWQSSYFDGQRPRSCDLVIFASSQLGQLGAQARAFIDRLHDFAGSGFSLPAPLQQDATWASRSLREFAKHSIAFAVRAGIAELLAAAMPLEAAEACARRRATAPPGPCSAPTV